jgi:hypothetical protein
MSSASGHRPKPPRHAARQPCRWRMTLEGSRGRGCPSVGRESAIPIRSRTLSTLFLLRKAPSLADEVARLISKEHDTGPRPVDRNASEKPTVRKEVALTTSEYQRALDLARGEGYVITKWIVALVRARLTGSAQFGQHELEKLGESNLRLLQIGRNLNQIAKTLNAQPWERTAYRVDLIEQLSVAIKEHTKAVSEAMTANADRWRIK